MSLRLRLTLIITALIALFTVATAAIIVEDTRRSIREEMEAGTKVTLRLLSTALLQGDLKRREAAPPDEALAFLHNLGRVRAHEIRMYDGEELAYTSPPSIYKAGRSAPAWFSRLMQPHTPEVEFKIPGGRIVVAPDASRSTLDAWDDLKRLFWFALGFLVSVNAVVFFLLGQSLRPVDTILSGLSEMQRGRFQVRLPRFSLPEFDVIGRTFNRMAGVLEESHAENERLALIAKQSSDAIIIHDLTGAISFWNPAAERLFGYRSEDIVGRSATLLTPAELHSEVAENLDAIRAGKVIENQHTRRRARSGRLVEVALSAAPLVDPSSGSVIGEICSMRDITEQKRAQDAEMQLEQNRRLTQLLQTHLEEERRAIARELHDELGQCVTAIKTIGAAIANRAAPAAPEIHKNAQTIVQVAGHIYDVVHNIIRQLRPSALDNLGLEEALEDWLAGWRSRYPQIHCEMRLSGHLDDLGESVNITVYRFVQEALTNIVRHAAATRAQIDVERRSDKVEVRVADNGKGLGEHDETEVARFGLMGMRERVQALGGSFELDSRPGAGLRVRAVIPLAQAAQPVATV